MSKSTSMSAEAKCVSEGEQVCAAESFTYPIDTFPLFFVQPTATCAVHGNCKTNFLYYGTFTLSLLQYYNVYTAEYLNIAL